MPNRGWLPDRCSSHVALSSRRGQGEHVRTGAVLAILPISLASLNRLHHRGRSSRKAPSRTRTCNIVTSRPAECARLSLCVFPLPAVPSPKRTPPNGRDTALRLPHQSPHPVAVTGRQPLLCALSHPQPGSRFASSLFFARLVHARSPFPSPNCILSIVCSRPVAAACPRAVGERRRPFTGLRSKVIQGSSTGVEHLDS